MAAVPNVKMAARHLVVILFASASKRIYHSGIAIAWSCMQGRFFADQALKFSQVPVFRAEHFPYAGPYPWLDRSDAIERIDQRLKLGELTEEDAEQCRFWSRHGYIILRNLIDDATLDTIWNAYEQAIRSGRIRLEAEPASAPDPYPGRFLNPHKKSASLCRVLKHAELLHWIRLLMQREPKSL